MEKPLGLSTSRSDESRRQPPHHVHSVVSGVVSPSSARPPGLGGVPKKQEVPVDRSSPSAPPGLGVKSSKCEVRRCELKQEIPVNRLSPSAPPGLGVKSSKCEVRRCELKQEVPVDRSSPLAPPGLGVKSSKCKVSRCESSNPPEKPPGLDPKPPKRGALKQDPKSSVSLGESSACSKHGSDRTTRSELAPPGLGATSRPPEISLGSDSKPLQREIPRYDTKLSTHSGNDPAHLKLDSDSTTRSEVCWDWLGGRCSRGYQCRYLHEDLVCHDKVSVQCHDNYIHVLTIRRLSTWPGIQAPQTDRRDPEVLMCAGTGLGADNAPEDLCAAMCIATSSRRT